MTLLERLRKVEPEGGDENRTRWYRNPDGPEAAAEVERLQARERDLEAAVREYLQAEGSSGDLGIRDDRYVVRQRLLAAVSAEKENGI